MSISPYPTTHKQDGGEEGHVREMEEIYAPGPLYPSEPTYDATEYQENRT